VVALLGLITFVSGCRDGWLAGPLQRRAPAAGAGALAWTPAPADTAVEVQDDDGGTVRYRMQLPVADGGAAPLRGVELRFHEPLDGARVDAWAVSDRGWLVVLAGRRIGGDTVVVPLPPGGQDRIELAVHHHLRPLPVVRSVRLGRSRGS
jgi:hypothetical protein